MQLEHQGSFYPSFSAYTIPSVYVCTTLVRPFQFNFSLPITLLHVISVQHGFIVYIFVHYLSHVRSCDATHEHNIIDTEKGHM